MGDEQNLWINLKHPCYTVDLERARPGNDEDARGLWGQGYVPLDRLRKLADIMWRNMESGMLEGEER